VSVDRRTPAIVGAAQVIQRPADWSDPSQPRGPIELMVDAIRDAASDAGSQALLAKAGWIGVTGGLFSFINPGQLIAARIGAPTAATCLSAISGSAPQDLVGMAAERIAAGELDVAVIVGGEARASTLKLRKLDAAPQWLTDPGEGEPEVLTGITDDAIAETLYLGAAAPGYALMDESLRRAIGRSIEAHSEVIAELWAGFSAVAATNRYAWDQTAHSAAEIKTPTADNRMISTPYPKSMVANNTVDMASAVVLCSIGVAESLGISTDRMVFPHVSTKSHDTWLLANRDVLHDTPALRAAGQAAFDHVGIGPDEVAHLDLYACFPSIVQISAAALGFDLARPLTVTGGLGFAGAPIANSSGQAIAAMVPRLREGGYGFVHANGGLATKHAFGVYSNHPSPAFRRIDCQGDIELRSRPAATDPTTSSGEVEAATVMFDRTGPSHVIASLRSGPERAFVKSSNPDLTAQALRDGLVGVSGPLPGAEPFH
jgi:acetyl-CoA C-acetyltransferase